MTQPILLIDQVYAVEVPDKLAQMTIDPACNLLMWWGHEGIVNDCQLPTGTWEIICTSKECTEEQAKGLVRELSVGQRWLNYGGDFPIWYHTARESLRSLLLSKNLNHFKNYIILKKTA